MFDIKVTKVTYIGNVSISYEIINSKLGIELLPSR